MLTCKGFVRERMLTCTELLLLFWGEGGERMLTSTGIGGRGDNADLYSVWGAGGGGGGGGCMLTCTRQIGEGWW